MARDLGRSRARRADPSPRPRPSAFSISSIQPAWQRLGAVQLEEADEAQLSSPRFGGEHARTRARRAAGSGTALSSSSTRLPPGETAVRRIDLGLLVAHPALQVEGAVVDRRIWSTTRPRGPSGVLSCAGSRSRRTSRTAHERLAERVGRAAAPSPPTRRKSVTRLRSRRAEAARAERSQARLRDRAAPRRAPPRSA